jgi:hypothetical protein
VLGRLGDLFTMDEVEHAELSTPSRRPGQSPLARMPCSRTPARRTLARPLEGADVVFRQCHGVDFRISASRGSMTWPTGFLWTLRGLDHSRTRASLASGW